MYKGLFSTPFGKKLSKALYSQLKRLFPRFQHHCHLCQEVSEQRICLPCQQQFLLPTHTSCRCCGVPLWQHALCCGECLKHPPAFDNTVSAFIYQHPLSDIIYQFKQRAQLFLGETLSDLLIQRLSLHYQQYHLPLPDLIIPVPLHWKKHWQRGFNQSAYISHNISRHFGIPLLKHGKRIKAAPEQKQLNKKERIKNLRHCFEVNTTLHGEHVVIVDDVMTTGATANTLAEELKAVGAGKVSIWILARTPKHD